VSATDAGGVVVRRLALILAALLGLGVLVAVPAAAAAGPPTVTVSDGTLRGIRADGVDSFYGIPYAAPPRRWQAPQPARPWTGVRDARSYGARCAALESTNGARSDAEDCLFLNVQRPTGTARDLPVYVFIHGGGLVNGSSDQADGAQIVRRGGVVTVSLNYRLGVFGFLGLPGMGPGAGNFGFLDQQAALRWVQRNIARFGGDPRQVTVGGESAGAWSVCAHLVASRGLYARAMMQSGSCATRPLAATRTASRSYETAAGCDTLACLRSKPAADLLDAGTGFSPALTSGTAVLPRPTAEAVSAGDFARVPVVNGANRDEGRTFVAGAIGSDRAAYEAAVRGLFGDRADAVLARYPWPARSDRFTAAYLLGAIYTDAGVVTGIGGCPELALTRAFARHTRTYAYEFDARYGPGLTPIPGYVWGAGHAAELAYLFPSFDNGTPIAPTFDAGERQLSRDMTAYWTAFVSGRTAQNLPAWPAYGDRILSLRPAGRTTTITTAQYRAEHRCGFWESLGQATA
jgi:carboxylesterase type B